MTNPAAHILSRRDVDFLLYEWLDVEALTGKARYADHGRETFDAVLDVCVQIASERFAPHNKKSDQEEPRIEAGKVWVHPEVGLALRAYADAGLFLAGQDSGEGGLQLPAVIEKAGFAWFMAANVATASYALLSLANANLLLKFGSAEQIERYARPILSGRFFGTMCLSEPQAGSSLADISTRAEARPDGSYRLFGNKMWISGGEHEMADNIVHLVLARIDGAPAGVKGLSLFVVPRKLVAADGQVGEHNDVVLAGLNHKMGYRGTVNTLLNFGEGRHRPGGAPGAVAFLVGQANQGLAIMFHMMNEARIGIGLGATALGYTGYLHALDYARTRLQGRAPGNKDPHEPQVPLLRHADVRRMLLAQKSYVEGALALNLYCARLVDEERSADADGQREALLLLDILTPIAKSWPSVWCLEANNLAIQVLGGYGYTRDFDVEQFYRDNRLKPIHEGTHGIQALDLLGRKVSMQGGAAFALLETRLRASIDRARAEHGQALGDYALALSAALDKLSAVTQFLNGVGDRELALANATAYLDGFGHVVMAWIWLEQAMAAARSEQGAADAGFYAGKRAACRYFYLYELPKAAVMLDVARALDPLLLNMQPDWF